MSEYRLEMRGVVKTFPGVKALDNAQLKLVLASFDQSSDHPLVSLMNKGMSYALHNGWQVLFFGLILLAIGLVLLLIFTREPKRPEHRESFGTPAPYMPQWEPAAPSEPEINPLPALRCGSISLLPQSSRSLNATISSPPLAAPCWSPTALKKRPLPFLHAMPMHGLRKKSLPLLQSLRQNL